jgi:hypothetical protein
MPIVGLKSSLPFISFLNSDSIVSIKKVNFTEDLGTIKPIKKFTNQWNRVAILYCDGIKTLIINTELQGTILLGCKNHCYTCRAHGLPDMTFL